MHWTQKKQIHSHSQELELQLFVVTSMHVTQKTPPGTETCPPMHTDIMACEGRSRASLGPHLPADLRLLAQRSVTSVQPTVTPFMPQQQHKGAGRHHFHVVQGSPGATTHESVLAGVAHEREAAGSSWVGCRAVQPLQTSCWLLTRPAILFPSFLPFFHCSSGSAITTQQSSTNTCWL